MVGRDALISGAVYVFVSEYCSRKLRWSSVLHQAELEWASVCSQRGIQPQSPRWPTPSTLHARPHGAGAEVGHKEPWLVAERGGKVLPNLGGTGPMASSHGPAIERWHGHRRRVIRALGEGAPCWAGIVHRAHSAKFRRTARRIDRANYAWACCESRYTWRRLCKGLSAHHHHHHRSRLSRHVALY